MTDSRINTKKYPYLHQSGTRTYRSICGRYGVSQAGLYDTFYFVSLMNKPLYVVCVCENLRDVNRYIEKKHPELKTRLCQLLVTDN